MTIAGAELLTQKDLCYRWGVCLRTVQNERKRWRLRPTKFIGLMPLFDPGDVAAVERRRHAQRFRELGLQP